MAVTINWSNYVINIPKADLTLVQSSPIEIRELDVNWFRLQLKSIEDNTLGITYPKTHNHNTSVTLGGFEYARIVEILPPYTVTFEDGAYAVNLVGANNNVSDRVNFNQVAVRSFNSAGLISNTAVEYSSFNGGVLVDVNSPYSGTLFPRGTEQMPVNNMTDALLIANYRGFSTIYLRSDITLGEESIITDFILRGQSHVNTQVIIHEDAQCHNITVENCDVSGTLDGGTTIRNCSVGTLNYVNGEILNSGLYGTLTLGGTEEAVIAGCYTIDQDSPPIINMGGSGQDLSMPNYSGIITITNLDSASEEVGVALAGGMVILDSSVTAGSVTISGIGTLENNAGPGIVLHTEGLVNKTTIADSVWDDLAADHTGQDTMGGTLTSLTTGGVDYDALADAVWDEDLSGHTTAGTAGAMFTNVEATAVRILGLSQENFRFFNHVYDGDGNLTSANIRIYPTSTDVENNTNHTDAYRVLASYTDGKLTDYQVLKI